MSIPALIFALLLILFLLVATAVAVGAEFAIVSVDKERIKYLASDKKLSGHQSALRLLPHIKDNYTLDHCVAACQIVITIASLVIGAAGEKYVSPFCVVALRDWFGMSEQSASQVIRVGLVVFFTGLQVLVGELIPKSIATRYTERVALFLIWPTDIAMKLTNPIINFLNGSGLAILRALGMDTNVQHSQSKTLKDLINMVDISAAHGFLAPEEGQQVASVLRFPNRKVSDVFRSYPPSEEEGEHSVRFAIRVRIPEGGEGIEESSEENKPHELIYLRTDYGMDKVQDIFERSPYSRLPVYGQGELAERIVGIVHIKDLSFALAEGLVDKALAESGESELAKLSLERFDAIYLAKDRATQEEIDRERDEAWRLAESNAQAELQAHPEHRKAIERKRYRAAKLAENTANDKARVSLLFPHGFIKRDLVVNCRLDDELDKVREELGEKRASMAIVEDEQRRVLGVLTLEDILEVLLGNSIIDEADVQYAAVSKKEAKRRAASHHGAHPSAVRVSKDSAVRQGGGKK